MLHREAKRNPNMQACWTPYSGTTSYCLCPVTSPRGHPWSCPCHEVSIKKSKLQGLQHLQKLSTLKRSWRAVHLERAWKHHFPSPIPHPMYLFTYMCRNVLYHKPVNISISLCSVRRSGKSIKPVLWESQLTEAQVKQPGICDWHLK